MRRDPAAASGSPSLQLAGLWLVAAGVLFSAPFLPSYELGPDGFAGIRVDGWGRMEGALGVLCVLLAVVLAIAAIATAIRLTALLPLHGGLLAGTAAVVVAGYQLLRLDSRLLVEGFARPASLGLGTWLVVAGGSLAAVAVALTLARLSIRQS